jgi:GNAT superfamily N-acetyltransferase
MGRELYRKMEIREATVDDAEDISVIVYALSEKHIAREFSAEGRETLLKSMTPAEIKKYIESGYRYHVAEIDGQIVGVVGVRENRHLYHLFVVEAHHRKGIARQLWKVAMEVCRLAGNRGEFTVNSSRYAKPLYERLGFVTQSGPEEKNGVVSIPMKLTVNS